MIEFDPSMSGLRKLLKKSRNKTKKSVFIGKPFWDELYTISKFNTRHMKMHHNVGLSLDDAAFLKELKTSDNYEIKELLNKY